MDPMTIITSIKAALELVKTGNDALESSLTTVGKLTDNPASQQSVVQLIREIKDAKLANLTVETHLLELIVALEEANEHNFSRYALFETPAGSIVYRLKTTEKASEKVHFLCPNCKEKGIKSILQGDEFEKTCHVCNAHYAFKTRDDKTHFPEDYGPWQG